MLGERPIIQPGTDQGNIIEENFVAQEKPETSLTQDKGFKKTSLFNVIIVGGVLHLLVLGLTILIPIEPFEYGNLIAHLQSWLTLLYAGVFYSGFLIVPFLLLFAILLIIHKSTYSNTPSVLYKVSASVIEIMRLLTFVWIQTVFFVLLMHLIFTLYGIDSPLDF